MSCLSVTQFDCNMKLECCVWVMKVHRVIDTEQAVINVLLWNMVVLLISKCTTADVN